MSLVRVTSPRRNTDPSRAHRTTWGSGRGYGRGSGRVRRTARSVVPPARPDSFRRMLVWTVGVVAVPALLLGIAAYVVYRVEGVSLARIAVIPRALEILSIVSGAGLVVWLLLLLNTFLSTRPRRASRGQRVTGTVLTMVLGVLVTVPMATTSYYAMTQRSTLDAIVTNEHTATVPTITHITRSNPWGSKRRVNVLLLGGDGGVGRTGIRTDTVIVLSMDTHTGKTVMFSLPRNLRNVPFPDASPLHALYPDGFDEPGQPDGESMLNAIYRNVPAAHPGVLGRSDNEGADALKEGVSGALGLPVDYYVLVNLDGFAKIVDAIGGITVNVNERVAINGQTDAHIPPTGWIEPGPDKHLDGFHALWFTRGRYGSTDYKRMERQRCAIRSIVDEASPVKLLTRYTQLGLGQPAHPAHRRTAGHAAGIRRPRAQDEAATAEVRGLPALLAVRPQRPRLRHRARGGEAGPAPPAAPRRLPLRSHASADSRNVDATDANSDCTYQPVSASDAG